jgi:hypothetical protein
MLAASRAETNFACMSNGGSGSDSDSFSFAVVSSASATSAAPTFSRALPTSAAQSSAKATSVDEVAISTGTPIAEISAAGPAISSTALSEDLDSALPSSSSRVLVLQPLLARSASLSCQLPRTTARSKAQLSSSPAQLPASLHLPLLQPRSQLRSSITLHRQPPSALASMSARLLPLRQLCRGRLSLSSVFYVFICRERKLTSPDCDTLLRCPARQALRFRL